ncbi:MAG: hypothetical protein AAGD38_16715 [Acidobacteriota bacterium]
MDTRIVFENHSHAGEPAAVILFQIDRQSPHRLPLVWRLIQHCGYECTHPFIFSSVLELMAFDSWGNCVVHEQLTTPSQVDLYSGRIGGTTASVEPAARTVVTNRKKEGTVHVFLARDGRAVTPWHTLAPDESTTFALDSTLAIVPWQGLRIGEEVPPAVIDLARLPGYTFNLLGIASAQLLMLGGGWGATATRFRFHLHNVRTSPWH